MQTFSPFSFRWEGENYFPISVLRLEPVALSQLQFYGPNTDEKEHFWCPKYLILLDSKDAITTLDWSDFENTEFWRSTSLDEEGIKLRKVRLFAMKTQSISLVIDRANYQALISKFQLICTQAWTSLEYFVKNKDQRENYVNLLKTNKHSPCDDNI